MEDLTAEATAHQRDLKVQDTDRVKYQRYWYDEGTRTVFCLVDASTKEAAESVRREAYGLVVDESIGVKQGS